MALWFLAILAALTRSLGDIRDPFYALGLVVLAGFLWRSFPVIPSLGRVVNWLVRWSSWLLALGLLRAFGPPLSLVLATAIVWAFDYYGPAEKRGQARPLIIAGALYSLWWTVFSQLPTFFRWMSDWSFAYSQVITRALTRPLILGPSAFAVDLLLLGLCGIAGVLLCSRPRRWSGAILSVLLLAAGHVLYIWLAPTAQSMIGRDIAVSNTPHLDMPALFLLVVVGVVVLFRQSISIEPSSPAQVTAAQRKPWVLASVGSLLLAFIIAGAASYNTGPVRVLFFDKKTLDFQVPDFHRFGDRSGGMFGFLATFLKESNYITYRQDLTPGILDSVDVIITANLLKKLSPDEKQRIWNWVEKGGGLLILGDHTGTDAIREPTNDLLAPSGLEINFDTAVPLRRSWVNAKEFLFHPLGRTGGIMDAELWLGASITPGPHGEPFVVGRGAFSDPGDLSNKDRAFLGNLEYDPGEPLGDVVLAAAVHWGKGKAILHGDTSPYQNGTIVRSHSMINREIRWLACKGWLSFVDRWRLPLLALLLCVAGTAFVIASGTWTPFLVAALLLPVVSVSFWSAIPGPKGTEWRGDTYKMAMIDVSHGQLFDGMSWEDRSIGGVEFNFMRNGYSMCFGDTPASVDEYHPNLYFLFAPTRPVETPTVDRLEKFVNNGGWVMVSAGWNMVQNVQELLDRFGLKMQNVPLGETSAFAYGDSLKMTDAYPIAGEGDNIETVATCFGYPTIKVARRGAGGIIAIGDSQFFYNRNIEGQEEKVVLENVYFIRELLRHTAGTTAQ